MSFTNCMEFLEKHFIAIMIFLLLFFTSLFMYALIAESKKETFVLAKVDWVCTKTDSVTTYIQSSDMMVPITSTECTQWSKRVL
jgi:hypothetical protein